MKREATDRRSISERRESKRYSVTIEIDWERNGARHPGTVSDLSEGGCFVLTGIQVSDGDEVKLFIPIGDGMKVQYAGEITNHVYEIGFAARFSRVSEAQRNVLRSYLMTEENAD
jgi:hypothetical protein